MSVDRNNRAHRPGGLPQGYAGTFAPMRAGGAGDVVPPPPARRRGRARGGEDDARAWGLKDRIESLADLGDGEQARRLAHEAGAQCARYCVGHAKPRRKTATRIGPAGRWRAVVE